MPLALAVGSSYAAAYGLNFLLNRRFNFRSRAPLGRQGAKFVVVALCDYAITVGLTTALAGAGLDFRLARLAAAGCVAGFSYLACRWWVFRPTS